MTFHLVDLAGDNSNIKLPSEDLTSASRKPSISNLLQPQTRQPLAPVQNNVRPRANAISEALGRAIDGMDIALLRYWVKEYASKDKAAAQSMQELYLVPGKDVVRYHADSESENDACDERSSKKEEVEKLRPIVVGDDELVPRKAKCLNCEKDFNVNFNKRGDCRWHTGTKEVLYEFWEEDDSWMPEPESLIDDPSYAEGFKWSCCDKLGDDEGCKFTKHKATINQMDYISANRNLKRKADEDFMSIPSKRSINIMVWGEQLPIVDPSSRIVYMIRHGEKPPKGPDGKDPPGLSAEGLTRAEGLVQTFGKESKYNIGLIIVEHPKKNGERNRPFKTVKPLADALGLKIHSSIRRNNSLGVAAAVEKYHGSGNILICWEHLLLADIAAALGVTQYANDSGWVGDVSYPRHRFDIIWEIPRPYTQITRVESEQIPILDDGKTPDQDNVANTLRIFSWPSSTLVILTIGYFFRAGLFP